MFAFSKRKMPVYLTSGMINLVSLLILLPFFQMACADNSFVDQQVLHSASELDYPPFAIVHPDGTAGGFSVELLKAVAEAAGMSVSFKVGPWNEIKQELADKVLDVLPLVSYSEERDKLYDFTSPYLKLNGTVFVRKENKDIQHLSDLKGKEVLVMQGDTAEEYVLREKLTDSIIQTSSYETAFKLLASGKHDAVVVQQIVGLQIIKELDITNVIPVGQKHISSLRPGALKLEGFEQKFCFAVPEGNQQLLSLLNEGLAIISLNGTYNTLYEKWFSPILPRPQVPVGQTIKQTVSIIVPLLLLFTLLGLWYLNCLVTRRTKYLELEIEKRKSIEGELEEANTKFAKAQELGKVGNWEYNLRTHETSGSPEAKKIFGFDVDSVSFTTESIISCIPDAERVRQAMANLIGKNIPYSLEFDIITRDHGERRTITSLAEADRDESGNALRVLGIIQDITHRKEMEDALRESEDMHRALVEGLPDIVIRFDRECRHMFVSENVCELVAMQAEQFIGKTHRELGFSEEQCIFWESSIKKVFAKGVALEIEYSFEAKNGQTMNNWRLIPERDNKGLVKSVLSLNRDITAHRMAENNYQTLFREMLEGFASHEIICDDNGVPVNFRFLAVNPSFERMTGLQSEKIVGRTVLEVLPNIENYLIETFGRVALTGEHAHFEMYSPQFQKHIEITAFRPVPNQFACVLTDITERKTAGREREFLQSQLIQAQKMEAIGTLAGGIAHDFNNILGAILGYAEMVREDCPPGSHAASDLDQILAAGNRAKDLVKQILAFSRQTETKKLPIQPALIVKETIKLLRASIPTTIAINQEVDIHCDHILADPTQIHQILMNLGTNAFHAMEENGGTLSISLKNVIVTHKDLIAEPTVRPGNFVQLSIADTGTGIKPELLEKIFEPYFTTKETGKGTGMGLAIIHGIVKSYGGFLTCESLIGEGTVFCINLPSSDERNSPDANMAESISAGGERILLIDDEQMLAELGQTMLERLGYTVTVRMGSLDALATFESQPDAFDLVITDQTMPGMTGVDMARRMLQIRPDMPIILCTGHSSIHLEEKVASSGIKGFGLKPLSMKGIAALIRKVLDEKTASHFNS
jgi:PAS domain S-box-containing protein